MPRIQCKCGFRGTPDVNFQGYAAPTRGTRRRNSAFAGLDGANCGEMGPSPAELEFRSAGSGCRLSIALRKNQLLLVGCGDFLVVVAEGRILLGVEKYEGAGKDVLDIDSALPRLGFYD